MTGNAIKSEALELHELSSEELDGASGGSPETSGQGGQNDPAQMFAHIMQQLMQGQG